MSFPFGENLGIMVKLGPLTKSDFCACMIGKEDRFKNHLAMMLSGEDVPRLVDAAHEVVAVAVVVILV